MAAATKARGSNPGLKGSALTGATKLQTSNPGSCVTASSPLPESHLWWAVSRSWCNLHLTPHINHIQPIFSAHFKTNTMVWRDKIWCERGERGERERPKLKVWLWGTYLIPSDTSLKASAAEGGKKKTALDGMQPFAWPHSHVGEEGRRQVDIWPVCYCEFQILWLSLTLHLLKFLIWGFLRQLIHSHWRRFTLTSLWPSLLIPSKAADTYTHIHTYISSKDSLFGAGKKT